MKKLNFNLGDGGVQGFLIQHGEKIGLIVIAGIAFLVFGMGYMIDHIDPATTPMALRQKADAAEAYINGNNWQHIGTNPDRSHKLDLIRRVNESNIQIVSSNYVFPLLKRPIDIPKIQRDDPPVFEPKKPMVEGRVVVVGLKKRDKDDVSPINELALALNEVPDEKQKPIRPRRKKGSRRRPPDAPPGGDDDPFGGGGYPMGEGGEGIPGVGDNGLPPGDDSELPGGENGLPPVGGADPGHGSLAGDTHKSLPDWMRQRLGGVRAPSNEVDKTTFVISVRSVVPFEKQWDAYEKVLAHAYGYEPSRDFPQYIRFEVQRLDVTGMPTFPERREGMTDKELEAVQEAQNKLPWKLVSATKFARGWEDYLYSTRAPDLVDFAYHDVNLTMDVPPILIGDYTWACTLEPDVPKRKLIDESTSVEGPTREAPKGLEDFYKDNPSKRPGTGVPGEFPGLPPGSGPAAGIPGSGDGPPGDVPPGYAGEGAMPPGSVGDAGGGIPGYNDPFGSGGGARAAAPTKPYKLVRFFDLSLGEASGVKPGRKYRYRMRVHLADPNNPKPETTLAGDGAAPAGMPGAPGAAAPGAVPGEGGSLASRGSKLDPATLLKKVWKRVQEVRAKGKHPTYGEDIHWRETLWSFASDAVEVPSFNSVPQEFVEKDEDDEETVRTEFHRVFDPQQIAGTVTPPLHLTPSKDVSYWRGEPSGKVVASVWDTKYSSHMSAERDVNLGTVLNFVADVVLLNPVSLRLHSFEKYRFKTDSIVLDIRGGDPLPGKDGKIVKKTALPSPAEFLILDGQGNLVVRNELDDKEQYRERLFVDDAPTGAFPAGMPGVPGSNDGGAGPPGMDGGMPPGFGPPMGGDDGGGGLPPGYGN